MLALTCRSTRDEELAVVMLHNWQLLHRAKATSQQQASKPQASKQALH
jgi:hypothetical protein